MCREAPESLLPTALLTCFEDNTEQPSSSERDEGRHEDLSDGRGAQRATNLRQANAAAVNEVPSEHEFEEYHDSDCITRGPTVVMQEFS